jgi:hypothetical protein
MQIKVSPFEDVRRLIKLGTENVNLPENSTFGNEYIVQVIMNEGRPVIGTDSETATVTLLLSASNKESAHGLGDEGADLYYVRQQEALLLKQVIKW